MMMIMVSITMGSSIRKMLSLNMEPLALGIMGEFYGLLYDYLKILRYCLCLDFCSATPIVYPILYLNSSIF